MRQEVPVTSKHHEHRQHCSFDELQLCSIVDRSVLC